MNNFAPSVKARLGQAGWQFLRHGKGDHDIWYDPQTLRKVAIDHKIKSRHSANGVLKKAGLLKQF